MANTQTTDPGTQGQTAPSLKRALTALTNGALTFAGVGVFAGLFSLYGFSMAGVGGSEFWGWIVVGVSVGAMVLVFAELASKYPFAGSMYQWPAVLAGKRLGWWVGWVYAGAMFPLMTAYYSILPQLMRPLFDLAPSFTTDATLILIAATVAVLWNMVRINVLGKITEWAMLLEITVVTLICIATFVLGSKHFGNLNHAATVATDVSGNSIVEPLTSFSSWLPLFIAAGVFNALWVQYTFENGGTLGEETLDAHRNAPRAIIGAFIFVILAGLLFYFTITPSIPNMSDAMLGGVPVRDAMTAHMPVGVFKLYLGVMAFGLIVATNTMFTGAVRHIFGMARDNQIPLARTFSRTLPNGSPWAAVLLLGALSVAPIFVFGSKTASMAAGATGAMYLAYFMVMVITLVCRLKGWPRTKSYFSLGKWGIPVNLLAVIGTGATFINLEWPRISTNPTYNQIADTQGGFFLADVPMAWILIGLPLVVGVLYYLLRSRQIHGQELSIDTYKHDL